MNEFNQKEWKEAIKKLIDEAEIVPNNITYSQHALDPQQNFVKIDFSAVANGSALQVKFFGHVPTHFGDLLERGWK